MRQRASYYARLLRGYWAEAESLGDFAAMLRARLALSKVGRLACPGPIVAGPRIRSLGGEVWLRSHTTDVSVLDELLIAESYLPVTRHLPKAPACIVDLGANVGLAARWFLARYPDATLVAVEPESGNVELLRRNLAPFGEQTRIVPSCIGGRHRRVTLRTRHGEYGYAMTELSVGSNGGPEVDVLTMDELVEAYGLLEIDLLKCDIEGAERELFEGSSSWIDRVGVAVVELHGSSGSGWLVRALESRGLELVEDLPASPPGNEVAIFRRADPRPPSFPRTRSATPRRRPRGRAGPEASPDTARTWRRAR